MNIEEIKQRLNDSSSGLSWRTRIEIAALIIFCAVVWSVATPAPAPVNEWHPAAPASQVVYVPKEVVKIKEVIVYKDAAKQSLDLPPEVKNDPAQHVLETAVTPSDDHAHTVACLLNTETGKPQAITRTEPLPWLAAEQRGSIGIGYGLTSGLMRGWALNAHEDLLQIKALHFGVDASAFTGGAYFAGVGMAYHW